MNNEKNPLDLVLSMSDAELSRKLALIASKLGVTSSVSPDRIRTMLRSMSESDLNNMLSSLGAERAAEIMNIIKGGT